MLQISFDLEMMWKAEARGVGWWADIIAGRGAFWTSTLSL